MRNPLQCSQKMFPDRLGTAYTPKSVDAATQSQRTNDPNLGFASRRRPKTNKDPHSVREIIVGTQTKIGPARETKKQESVDMDAIQKNGKEKTSWDCGESRSFAKGIRTQA